MHIASLRSDQKAVSATLTGGFCRATELQRVWHLIAPPAVASLLATLLSFAQIWARRLCLTLTGGFVFFLFLDLP
jgi:hypothetical protein